MPKSSCLQYRVQRLIFVLCFVNNDCLGVINDVLVVNKEDFTRGHFYVVQSGSAKSDLDLSVPRRRSSTARGSFVEKPRRDQSWRWTGPKQ